MATDNGNYYQERILCVLVHIQQNLDEDLTLDRLARIACFSPFHFHRIFKALVGETLGEHVRRLRLERAALHLKYGPQPILNLALEAGFESHEAFTRAFKTLFGCPPVQFRRRHQDQVFTEVPSGIHFEPHGGLNHFHPAQVCTPELEVRIEWLEPTRVLFHRALGPYEESGPRAWNYLQAWAEQRGLMAKARLALGICHDDPDVTPPERVRFDAALVTEVPAAPEGEVGVQEIPAGHYVVATFRGGPDELDHMAAWSVFLGDWIARTPLRLSTRPSFESYLNNPKDVPPEEVLTELWAPIESPKGACDGLVPASKILLDSLCIRA